MICIQNQHHQESGKPNNPVGSDTLPNMKLNMKQKMKQIWSKKNKYDLQHHQKSGKPNNPAS